MPNINTYFKDTGIGSGSNRATINEDGQINGEGASGQWDDIIGDVMSRKLYTITGKVDFNWDENTIKFQSGGDITTKGDRLQFNIQKPHAVKIDSEMRFHLHYEKTNTTAYTFTLQYRIQENGGTKTTTWTTITTTTEAANEVFTYSSGTLNQIVKFPAIDWSSVGISSTVQFRLARTDSETGDVNVSFADAHVFYQGLGSNSEYAK